MKTFLLKRKRIYTEIAEVVAETWEDAKAMLYSEDTVFEALPDDESHDDSIEYVGEDNRAT